MRLKEKVQHRYFTDYHIKQLLLFTNLIISSSWYLYSYLISFCPVLGPVPDSAFYIFFYVNFTPD